MNTVCCREIDGSSLDGSMSRMSPIAGARPAPVKPEGILGKGKGQEEQEVRPEEEHQQGERRSELE